MAEHNVELRRGALPHLPYVGLELDLFDIDVPFDNATPIYLINMLWKLGLGFRLESELHYFSIFHEE